VYLAAARGSILFFSAMTVLTCLDVSGCELCFIYNIFIEHKINAFQYFLTVLFQEVGQVKNTQEQVKRYPCAGINSNVCHLEHRTVSIIKYVNMWLKVFITSHVTFNFEDKFQNYHCACFPCWL